jgi:hypothetical protein
MKTNWKTQGINRLVKNVRQTSGENRTMSYNSIASTMGIPLPHANVSSFAQTVFALLNLGWISLKISLHIVWLK